MVGQLQAGLPRHEVAGYNRHMARELRTADVRIRVKPSFRARLERIADATGESITEAIESAVAAYEATPAVRRKLADLAAQKKAQGGE